jgi:hypothetical protein
VSPLSRVHLGGAGEWDRTRWTCFSDLGGRQDDFQFRGEGGANVGNFVAVATRQTHKIIKQT